MTWKKLAFSDEVLLLSGGTMSGAIAMGTNKITGLGDPAAAQDAATKAWVEANTATNPMTEDLDMGGNDIVKVSSLLADGDASNAVLQGGVNAAGSVFVYGRSHATHPGKIRFVVPNVGGVSAADGGHFEGMTNTPKLVLDHGLDMNSKKITSLLAGTAAADAIRKDQALLLDGTQAMVADLNFNKKNADAMCIEPLASAPATPGTAQIYYNTTDDHLHVNVV